MSKKSDYAPDYARVYPGVEISAEVLAVLEESDCQMERFERRLKRDRYQQDSNGRLVRDENGQPIKLPERETSLDKMVDEDWDFPSGEPTPEDSLIARGDTRELYRLLGALEGNERDLIAAIYFRDATIRGYADSIGASKSAVDRLHRKILKKMKNNFQN